MQLLRSMLAVAALALAGNVWAHDGHGRGHGHAKHDRHHHGWHDAHDDWKWRHHGHYRHHVQRHRPAYYGYYYAPPPYPAYAYAAPAPGVHIVVPDIYIPLR